MVKEKKWKRVSLMVDEKVMNQLKELGFNVSQLTRNCLKKRLEQELGLKNVEERDKE